MKRKASSLLLVAFAAATVSAQVDTTSVWMPPSGDRLSRFQLYGYRDKNVRFTFKLDSQTGRLWVVDNFSRWFQDLPDTEAVLDTTDKSTGVLGERFILYPSFRSREAIMLNEATGKTYIVRWSQDRRYRVCGEILPQSE